MKKTNLLLVLSCLVIMGIQDAKAQIELIGNTAYGQLFDLQYSPTNEDLLIARTVMNHVVKSTNNGQDWEIIYSDPVEYVRLFDLRFLDNGSRISFIISVEGSSYSSVSIFDLTTEEIVKQYSVPNPSENGILIESYAIYASNWDNMLMHTTYNDSNFSHIHEVFYTLDGGQSWESVYFEPDYNEISINNVTMAPDNPEKLFLMRGVSPFSAIGGLFVSEDAGETWREELAGYTFDALVFNPTNANDIMLGTFYESPEQQIYRSLDGGVTWTVNEIEWTDMSNNNINSISFNPQNPNEIIILEENEIVVSIDNGANWINHVYNQIDPESYYYGLNASFRPNHSGHLVMSANYYSFTSEDYATTIDKLENPFINSTGKMASFQNENESHLYYGLRSGFIHKDMQTGEESPYGLMPLNQMFGTGSKIDIDPLVAGRIFAGSRSGWNSYVRVSANHGEDMQVAISSSEFLIMEDVKTAPSNTDIVWISTGPNIYKLDLSDMQNITNQEFFPGNTDEQIYALLIDDTDPDTVFAAQWNQLYKTTDGGATWGTVTNGLEGLLVGEDVILGLEYNPLNPSQYGMTTTKGIYISNDKGATWELSLEGLFHNIAFSSFNEGAIVATTHYSDGYNFPLPAQDARIVFSSDGGVSWEEIASEELHYLNTNSSGFQFNDESATVYFGVSDLGLVSFTIDLGVLSNQSPVFESSQVTIHPNPTESMLTITTPLTIADVSIYNINGQRVLKQEGFTKSTTLDLSILGTGVYIIRITDNNGKQLTAKVIVR